MSKIYNEDTGDTVGLILWVTMIVLIGVAAIAQNMGWL